MFYHIMGQVDLYSYGSLYSNISEDEYIPPIPAVTTFYISRDLDDYTDRSGNSYIER